MSNIKLKNGKTKILDMSKIESFMDNYRKTVGDVESNVKELNDSLYKEKVNRRQLLEKSMLTAGNEYRSPIAESEAKIANYEEMLFSNKQKLAEYQNILKGSDTFRTVLSDFKEQSVQDIQKYLDTDERALYEEMAELRNRYEEIIGELNNKRKEIANHLFKFNSICKKYGYTNFEVGTNFHTNLQTVNKLYPDCGIVYPAINVNIDSSTVTNRFKYAREGIERFI